jgi:alanine racemase
MDGVRLGSALLGRMAFPTGLRPLGCAVTRIEEIRQLPPGHTTGYGGIWKAKKETTLAILPIGWAHGLRMTSIPDKSHAKDCLRGMFAELKGLFKRPTTYIRIGNKLCPVVGAVGSLHCAVDVTGASCAIGDEVILPIKPMYMKDLEVEFR